MSRTFHARGQCFIVFPLNGEPDVIVLFVVDEPFEVVSFRKAFNDTFTVFEDAANKIVCDTQIEEYRLVDC